MVKKNFNRKNLANRIYKNLGFSKNFSLSFVDNFFDTLVNELIKTKKIKITSFGTFKVIEKKQRVGRNPKTKVEAIISSRKVIKFTPSILLKGKLNNL